MDVQQIAIVAGVVVAVLAAIGWWLSRKQTKTVQVQPTLSIDVNCLGDRHPPAQGRQLLVYNTPTWLAAVVLAPSGRDRAMPVEQAVPEIADFAVPGLKEVILQHRSKIFVWPAQVSSRGFTHLFGREVSLPGDAGKGTPWCSVAGGFTLHGTGYVMGLVCRTERADNLDQFIIEQGKNWLDVVRTSPGA